MKVAVVILVVLGVLAAGSAALLFQWVQAKNAQTSSIVPAVEVVLAQTDLPARLRLVADDIRVEKIPRAGLPAGVLTNVAQVVGKTLKVDVVKGQPLTESSFLPENAIDGLLKPGMLAFQISLARRSTAVDLLYPGCIVDVFATFPLQDRQKGDAVVTPLLQNIHVLGVRDETVISATEDKNGSATGRRSTPFTGDVTVALEVSARQAAALQLAMERGTLGLGMRNPLDKTPNPIEPMVMKEGQLTASSEAMDTKTLALYNQIQEMLGNRPLDANSPSAGAKVASVPTAAPSAPVPEYLASLSQKSSAWAMTIIRGQKVEETELKVSPEQSENPNQPAESTEPASEQQSKTEKE